MTEENKDGSPPLDPGAAGAGDTLTEGKPSVGAGQDLMNKQASVSASGS